MRATRRSAELSKFAALPVLGALLISLVGARFARREKLAAVWFVAKGFACVVYGLLVFRVRHPAGMGGGSPQAPTVVAFAPPPRMRGSHRWSAHGVGVDDVVSGM
ncbi:hypothetical protein [Streptomyces rapamycinicus]|uniref:Uncharacterized protein n=2 Tax=Streptomyces rapamycinicus TaxID=1226757 RepID=A0A0A0NF01_STRRN|nr:hypothetical protein [Streptomyces rapamycinicus]AGP55574.1 hypothetical protein M271_20140 [Streptomyces rapamycinicus NRRL 5491]MBB4783135.1 hypothetical protein [Streptomyces rapamycinicus]RLV81390.1 hypothetical protein D3C57_123435 [Streptomyces rapamycinicus NRRL 5491]